MGIFEINESSFERRKEDSAMKTLSGVKAGERHYRGVVWGTVLTVTLILLTCQPLPPQPERLPKTVKWRFEVGTADFRGHSPVVGSDGTVYLLGDRDLHAVVDAGSHGEMKQGEWPFGAIDVGSPPRYYTVDIRLTTGPTIGVDEAIYVAGVKYEWWYSGGNLHSRDESLFFALDLDGTVKWTLPVRVVLPPAVALDGSIWLFAENTLKKISMNGEVLGTLDLGGIMVLDSPVIGADGRVFLVATNGVYKFDVSAESDDQWVREWHALMDSTPKSSLAIAEDASIYLTARDGFLYRVSTQGQATPITRLNGYTIGSPTIGAEGTVYVGSTDNNVYAIDPQSGSVVWSHQVGGDVSSSPAVGSDGWIYVGSMEERLYAFDPEPGGPGEQWYVTMESAVEASPVIDRKGTVFVGSGIYLYAVETESGDLADAAWPMYRHDRHHSGSAQRLSVEPVWKTAYRKVIDEESTLALLRQYRDQFLIPKTKTGERYISLLYENSDEVLRVLSENPELNARAKELIAANKEALRSILSGKRGEVKDTDSIVLFLKDFETKSTPDLRRLLETIIDDVEASRLQDKPFLGMELK